MLSPIRIPTASKRDPLTRYFRQCMAVMAILLVAAPAWSDGEGEGEVVHSIDFTAPTNGDAMPWLRDHFELRRSADDLSAEFTDRGLVLSTGENITGLFVKELNLSGAERVRVRWGVDRYPEGANWEQSTYRVPIAIMVSFGDTDIASGSLFVPNTPYFISLFLSKNAEPDTGYTANYYHKGGRYFCDPCHPPTGDVVTTTFNLTKTFKRTFDKQAVPPITGFSFQMNTDDTSGGARAFIEQVEFLRP